jgi:glycosyltransferase involved in cell wall biosynthesis
VRLSIVIPAYDEASRIAPTLAAYRDGFGDDVEIIVVANGCHDDTAAIARRIAAERAGIEVIEIPEAIGKGAAVRAGFARARGDWVGFVDADLATSPAEFARVAAAAEGADGAIASRWARGARIVGRTPLRWLAGRTFAALVQALFGLPFVDTQCGAKVVHRRFLPGYLTHSRVTDLAFDVELLLLLLGAGARLIEVPTEWVAQPGSASLGSPTDFARHGWQMVRSLLRLRSSRPRFETVPTAR